MSIFMSASWGRASGHAASNYDRTRLALAPDALGGAPADDLGIAGEKAGVHDVHRKITS
jgi:hypothetical protein